MARIIYDMSEDTRIRELARMREKALHDEASALKDATDKGFARGKKEGIEEGRAEGRAEGIAEGRAEVRAELRNEMIEKMRAMGMTEEQIDSIFSSD